MKLIKQKIFDYIDSAGFVLKKKNYLNRFESIPSLDIEQKKILSVTSKFSMTSKIRQHTLINLLNYIFKKKIDGDLVECGTWLGGNLIIFDKLRKKYRSNKKIYGYDTFEGFPEPGHRDITVDNNSMKDRYEKYKIKKDSSNWNYCSLDDVKKNFQDYKIDIENLKLIKGKVENTLLDPKNIPDQISILKLDTCLYESTKTELEILFPRLQKGGILIIDNYSNFNGVKEAVIKYFEKKNFELKYKSLSGQIIIDI